MHVCILDDWEGAALDLADWDPVRRLGHLHVHQRRFETDRELIDALTHYDVLVIMRERTRFHRDVIEALPNLRLIVTTGPRNAAIDLEACRDAGVTVCATSGGGMPVVELAWALILSALRGIPEAAASMRAGEWQSHLGTELAGLRLGLLGLGRTGGRMARIATAFDMEVLAWSPHLTQERADEHGVRLVGKRALFEQSDVVSVHLVLAEATRGLVGADELRALGPRGWLVNTGRGPILDEDALVAACERGWIAGALLDVYAHEPLPADHRLRAAPRVLLTPHLGYVTEANLRTWYREAVEDIVAFAEGAPIRPLTPPPVV